VSNKDAGGEKGKRFSDGKRASKKRPRQREEIGQGLRGGQDKLVRGEEAGKKKRQAMPNYRRSSAAKPFKAKGKGPL